MARAILITGASRGIGRAAAYHFATVEKAELHLLGRDQHALAETAEGVRARGGFPWPVLADVTDRKRLAEVAEGIASLGVIVANAGIGGMTPLDAECDERFDEILATDVGGVWNTVRAFAPKMGNGGRIVVVSSVLGRFGVGGYGAYCAAKHGVIGLTKALALELIPRGIHVNAVAPGWVETEMALSGVAQTARSLGMTAADFRREAEGRVPVGRFFQPEEIAHGIAWLASPHNTMQVGQCLDLDGGVVQA
jgi:NAD(P)-dependent dehydrogenase (short-subunit alcohol dehydrogenase family)